MNNGTAIPLSDASFGAENGVEMDETLVRRSPIVRSFAPVFRFFKSRAGESRDVLRHGLKYSVLVCIFDSSMYESCVSPSTQNMSYLDLGCLAATSDVERCLATARVGNVLLFTSRDGGTTFQVYGSRRKESVARGLWRGNFVNLPSCVTVSAHEELCTTLRCPRTYNICTFGRGD